MIPLTCPHDQTPLDKDWRREVYVCPGCRGHYVVSISDAYHNNAIWNRHAPGAGAVEAVMARLKEKADA
jgi:uncharacterized protein YbaR (Trm112 family)